jgi:hypothetical protein
MLLNRIRASYSLFFLTVLVVSAAISAFPQASAPAIAPNQAQAGAPAASTKDADAKATSKNAIAKPAVSTHSGTAPKAADNSGSPPPTGAAMIAPPGWVPPQGQPAAAPKSPTIPAQKGSTSVVKSSSKDSKEKKQTNNDPH